MKHNHKGNFIDYSKGLEKTNAILEARVGKDILGHYVENLKYFKNTRGSENKKKIKSEEFNKLMTYLLMENLNQSKYASLENVLASQYSMKIFNTPRT